MNSFEILLISVESCEVHIEISWSQIHTNIVGHLKNGVTSDMQQRAIQYWTYVDTDLGARIRAALQGNRGAREGEGARLRSVTQSW